MNEAELVVADAASGWGGVALAVTVVVAVVATWLTPRIGAAVALHRWQRWLHGLAVCGWVAAVWLLGVRALAGATVVEAVTRASLMVVAVIAAMPILRDVLAGFALTLEGRHHLGDDVRVERHAGRIVAFGLRSAVLRDRDGTEITVPYRRLVSREIVRLSLARRDAPCEFEIEVPPGRNLDELSARLHEAAILSPYAAPGRRPEVFAVADAQGRARVRVLAFVFDRAQEARYRGDVLARAGLLVAAAPEAGSDAR